MPPWRVSIVGAERCTAARCDLSAGIQADNRAGTVTFRLRSPEPDFLYQLALPYADVLPSSTPFRVLKRPPGATGEYEFANVRTRRAGPYEAIGTALLVRNPAYRDYSADAHPAAFPERIAVRVVLDSTRAVTAVKQGRANIAFAYGLQLPESALEKLSISDAGGLHADPLGSTQYMFLNTRVPPFDNGRERSVYDFIIK